MRTANLLSAEEFFRVAQVIGPSELVNGEIVPRSFGTVRNCEVIGNGVFLLCGYDERSRIGRALAGKPGIIVRRNPDTVRGADLAFISYQRLPKNADLAGFLDVPPELVIEVLSGEICWAEMEIKIGEYHAARVDLVWVVDPRTRTLHAYPRSGLPVLLRDSDVVSADPFLPGFSCHVSEFFGD